MTFFKNSLSILAVALALVTLAPPDIKAQTATSSTTTASAIGYSDQSISVTSATGMTAPTTAAGTSTVIMIEQEAMNVLTVNGTYVGVERGAYGTLQSTHLTGATLWLGPPNYFFSQDPVGSCTSSANINLPRPSLTSGKVWDCKASHWVTTNSPQFRVFIPASHCGFFPTTTAAAAGWPKLYAVAVGNEVAEFKSDTTAGTIEVTCQIQAPKGSTLTGVSLLYGIQTTAMASIATATFKSVTYPTSTAAGAAAAGTVAAAGGTLTVLPTVLQVATTTAGRCYNEFATFASPISTGTDNVSYAIDQIFTTAGTTATILNVCGVEVYYTLNGAS